MKIGVTGANGFLGSHLVTYLKSRSNIEIQKYTDNLIDKKNKPKLSRFVDYNDIIVHLACLNRASSYDLIETNILGTLNICECFTGVIKPKKLIFASTAQVYLENSIYGISKLSAENIINAYANKYGFKAINLRLANIYGPFCKPNYNSVIATFIYQAMHQLPISLNGNGEQKRDYIFVDDVLCAIYKVIINHNVPKDCIIDICSQHNSSLNEIIAIIRQFCPCQINIQQINTDIKEFNNIKQSNITAKNILKWKPKINLKTGIKNIFEKEYGCKY
jgi:UDP-2-acetamido-2,6-beta-L-arabino-hexul-4-ose reductase